MNLYTDFAGFLLEHPLMNAAGSCKLTEHVGKLARSASSAIVVGSFTMDGRPGNTGNVFWRGPHYSLNSLGIPNPGREYYRNELPEMSRIAADAGKPLVANVAGFTPEEYGILAEIAIHGGANMVELNLGCPNIWDGGKQKRIACFDLDLVEEIVTGNVRARIGDSWILGVKPSPFSDPVSLDEFAHRVGALRVDFVTAVNTFPNAFDFDDAGNPRISPAGGLAGLAGPALKPIALGQIRQYGGLLPGTIHLAGAGGVETGRDVLDFMRAGARAVQINTAYGEDERVFERILTEYVDVAEAEQAAAPA